MDNPLPETLTHGVMQQQQWHRLSPIAVVYFAVALVKIVFNQIFYLIPAFIVTYNSIKNNPLLGCLILAGLGLWVITAAVLTFYYFQYRLSENTVEIRSGVFVKKYLNLPFNRIQNIELEQPFFYRPGDFICLLLDTAGSSKQEARLAGLTRPFAEQLKQQILSSRQKEYTAEVNTQNPATDELTTSNDMAESEQNERLLNRRSISDLIIHGICSNRIWIFLGMLAPFYGQLTEQVLELLLALGIDVAAFFDSTQQSWLLIALYALSLTMLIMLCFTLLSIAGAILSFYGFTLSRKGDSYIRRSGLLTRYEVSMKLSRLQWVMQKQDWLDRLLRRVNLSYEQIQHGQQFLTGQKIMVPSVSTAQSQQLINEVYPENQLASIRFNGISKRFLWRYLGLWAPVFVLLQLIISFGDKWHIAWLLLIPAALIALLVVMRWYR